ncbi:MAG TPA: GntR family transcriptional regulator [Planctomycetaceae bacterium]|jgi:GntR family transcriptional regulator|nr:GntR family transcriptional regulator [Planctomycetaceae bacterium]
MFIRVERGSSVPISRQIGEQIRAQCLSGTLKPGDSLPAVRRLAQQLAVNVNTILRVYERLAADRLIEMRHGDGTYVLPLAARASGSRLLAEQRDQYTCELNAIVRRGLLLGLKPHELRRMVTSALAAGRSGIDDVSVSATGQAAAAARSS